MTSGRMERQSKTPRFLRASALARIPAMAIGVGAGALVVGLAALGGAAPWALISAGIVIAVTLAWSLGPASRGQRAAFAVTVPGPEGLETLPVLSIVEQLPDPIILLDSAGRVMLSNRAAHGVIQPALPGRHISAVIRVPTLLDAVDKVLGGAESVAVDYSVMVPIERHLRAHVCPIRVTGAGKGTGAERHFGLIILHDMTSIKRLEQMRADFVASASHELRTPLASLSGFIETLRGPARNDAAARDRFLDIMEEQANRMGRLVADLLSLSRIELNEHVPPSGSVDLAAVVRDVVDAVTPIAEERGVAIEVRGLKSCRVTGERDDLLQVFQNLVDNAIKYGGDGGRILIHLSEGEEAGPGVPAGPVYSVSVRDFGPGIAREHLPRLTERFYRVDVQQSRSAGGTGLGLAIVKHIVSRHGGWLRIDSQPGQGSKFTVYFPPEGRQRAADTADRGEGDKVPQLSVSPPPARPSTKAEEKAVVHVVSPSPERSPK